MIDHFTLTVRDLQRSKKFYQKALAPLGYKVLMDFGSFVGFGDEVKPYFWLKGAGPKPREQSPEPTQPMHIAFRAKTRDAVDKFHAAALAAGARDDGQPGPRKEYHPSYYGAFVIELDGHPIEAVCHTATAAAKKPAARKVAAKKSRAKPARRKKRR